MAGSPTDAMLRSDPGIPCLSAVRPWCRIGTIVQLYRRRVGWLASRAYIRTYANLQDPLAVAVQL